MKYGFHFYSFPDSVLYIRVRVRRCKAGGADAGTGTGTGSDARQHAQMHICTCTGRGMRTQTYAEPTGTFACVARTATLLKHRGPPSSTLCARCEANLIARCCCNGRVDT